MRINVRFLAQVGAALALLVSIAFAIHYFQTRRTASLVLEQARQANGESRFEESARLYRQYLATDQSAGTLAEYGGLLFSLSEYRDAFFQLSKALRKDPSLSEARGQLVESALYLGRWSDAKDILEQETNGELRESPERLRWRAIAQKNLGNFSAAREDLELAIEQEPSNPQFALEMAEILLEDPQPDQAARRPLDQLVENAPDLADSFVARATFLLNQSSKTNDPKTYRQMVGDAYQDIKHGLDLAPDNEALAFLAARVAGDMESVDEVRAVLSRALAENPQIAVLYIGLAQLAGREQDPESAEAYLQKGLEELPGNPEILWSLTRLQIELEELEEVAVMIDELRKSNFARGPVNVLEAQLRMAQQEWREAAEILENSRPMLDGSDQLLSEVDFQLATCYRMIGDQERELLALRRSVDAQPLFIPIRRALALSLYSSGRLTEAIGEMEIVVREGSENGVADLLLYARLRLLNNMRQQVSAEASSWRTIGNILESLEAETESFVAASVLRAELLLAQGKADEAQSMLESRIEEFPKEISLRTTLLLLLARNQNWDQYRTVLDQAEETLGDSTTLRLARAEELFRRDGEDFDLESMNRLATPKEDWTSEQKADLAIRFARLFLSINEFEASAKQAQVILESDVVDPTLSFHLMMFDIAMGNENVPMMVDVLENVREIEGDGPLWKLGKAVQLTVEATQLPEGSEQTAESLYEEALATLDQVESIRSSWPRVPRTKAEIFERLSKPDLATAEFVKAIELGERDPNVVVKAFSLLSKQKRYSEADSMIRKLLDQKASLTPELTRLASEVSLRQEEFDRALLLAKQQADSADDVESKLWLANVHRILGDTAAAQAELRETIDSHPENPAARYFLVRVLVEEEDMETARSEVELAAQSLSGPEGVLALGQCYEVIQELDSAEQVYLSGLESPEQPRIRAALAQLYMRQRDLEKAKPELEKLVSLPVANDTTDIDNSDANAAQQKELKKWSSNDQAQARRDLALVYGYSDSTEESYQAAMQLLDRNRSENLESIEDMRVRATILGRRPDTASLDRSIALMERVVEDPDAAPNDRFMLADFYARKKDWPRYNRAMLAVIPKAGASEPDYVGAYAWTLITEMDAKSDGEVWLDRLKAIAPDEERTKQIEAELLFRSKEYDRLLGLIEKHASSQDGVRWGAESAEAFASRLGEPKDLAQRFLALAERLYRQIDASDDKSLSLMGFQARQGKLEEILTAWSRNGSSPAVLALVAAEAVQGRNLSRQQLAQLLGVLKISYDNNPQNQELGLILADTHAWLGDWQNAQSVYQSVHKLDPDFIPALNNLAMVLGMSGQHLEEASERLNRAVGLEGETYYLLDTRGVIRMARGQLAEAEQDFRRSLMYSKTPDVYFHLALALYKQDKQQEAREFFERAQQLGNIRTVIHPLELPTYFEFEKRMIKSSSI